MLLTTPSSSGDLNYYYRITDAPGGQAVDGVLTVQVRDKAPLRAPIARDDVVTAAETLGRNTASVDVLANDSDPDGVSEDLEVSSGERGVTVTGGKLDITLDKARRVVLYTVTDVDGLTSRAVVSVPGTSDLRPVIDPGADAVKVVAGKTVEVALADHVVVRDGRSPSLTFGNTVQAGPGGVAKAVSQRAVSFTADQSFSGPSAITFEVTDGSDADDASGLVATLSIPVEVLPAKTPKDDDDPDRRSARQPTFTPTGLQVAPGEDAVEADLRAMVTDPDEGDLDKLTFTLGAVEGDTATRQGVPLRLDAARRGHLGHPGRHVAPRRGLGDGRLDRPGHRQGAGHGRLVHPAAAPGPRRSSIDDGEAGRGRGGRRRRLRRQPFAVRGPADHGAERRRSPVATPTGKVSLSGTIVTITPDKAHPWSDDVRVSVGDATKDPARQVDGLIRLTVRDRPDAPTGLKAEAIESNTVTLSWTAPSNNGELITGYTAQWAGETFHCGQATTCTVTGLKNAVEYTFTVTATNAIGTSDKSAASNPVKPDQRPDPPSSVLGEFGDASVKLQWNQPVGDFSAVTSYSILMSPGNAAGVTQLDDLTGTSTTVDNLVNGTAYTFQVLAHNDHPEPSDPSPSSSPIIPAGVPFAAAAPTVQKRAADATQPSATVKWVAPNGNGDDNLVYTLSSSNGRTWNGITGTTPGGPDGRLDHRRHLHGPRHEQGRAGRGVTGVGAPAVLPEAGSGLQPRRAGDRGQQHGPHHLRRSGRQRGLAQRDHLPLARRWHVGHPARGGGTVTNGAFPNGTNVSVEVWATSTVRGESAAGDARSDAANAYGPPDAPRWRRRWDLPGGQLQLVGSGVNNNGRDLQSIRVQVTGAATRTASTPCRVSATSAEWERHRHGDGHQHGRSKYERQAGVQPRGQRPGVTETSR